MKPGQVRAAALHHPRHGGAHEYPAQALAALACPHCGATLAADAGILSCSNSHTFDVARQGYVALLGPRARTDTADSADMVAARVDFLNVGHYVPIAAAVAASAVSRVSEGSSAAVGPAPLLEVGAGTGYYLSAALDAFAGSCGIAVDSSKFAARRAAADPRVVSVVADAWSVLPVQDGSIGTVLSIFAPRDPAEIARVLGSGGRLVVVTPNPGHLLQLRERLAMLTVDDGKADRLAENFDGLLTGVGRQVVEFEMNLTRADVSALVRMGPSARHLTADALDTQIQALNEIETVTCTVTVSIFEK